MYPFPLGLPVVPGSDGAGTVVKTGAKVTQWKKGDKVVTLFNQAHQFGPMTVTASKSGLGGVLDGTIRQYGGKSFFFFHPSFSPLSLQTPFLTKQIKTPVFNENGLVPLPRNLNPIQGATLTCAALTSWNALYGLKPLLPGQTVLVQGTGGVSLFALQFAKAAGAVVIATTSTKEKGDKMKQLGADHVINYVEDPNWGETARKLTTDGVGVDHIIEVGGAGTMTQSLKAVRFEGVISLIGFLGGAEPKDSILEPLSRVCTLRGVYVGSRAQMLDMIAAIEANDIRPVVDGQVFTLETAKQAYEYMWAKKHFGKVGIKIE